MRENVDAIAGVGAATFDARISAAREGAHITWDRRRGGRGYGVAETAHVAFAGAAVAGRPDRGGEAAIVRAHDTWRLAGAAVATAAELTFGAPGR